MADATAQAKEAQAKSAAEKQRAVDEAYSRGGTPTPTQEENDLAKLGVTFDTHQDDGSGPSPEFRMVQVNKQSEAKPSSGGGYQTRSGASQSQAKESTAKSS